MNVLDGYFPITLMLCSIFSIDPPFHLRSDINCMALVIGGFGTIDGGGAWDTDTIIRYILIMMTNGDGGKCFVVENRYRWAQR